MNWLTEEEEEVLIICARMNASENKNVSLHSIQKRYKKFSKTSPEPIIKKLIRKGLMRKYRKQNYSMTQEGRMLAHDLYDRELSKLGINILLFM